jgi:protein-S-isoprenylcysteine O-methyltransferase Ste14
VALLRGTRTRQFPFVIKGPYRWVRHPLYFFALILFWACPVITLDRLLFNILWTVWVILATVLEERDLVSKFGDAYVQYQREVPMIFPWRAPSPESPDSDTQ